MSSKKRKQNRKIRRERGHWMGNTPAESQPLAPGHYLSIDPRLIDTEIVCPDCAVQASGGQPLDHASSCPIGKGYRDASDDDRAWFASHPEATERRRLPYMAEMQAVMLVTGRELPDMPLGVRYEPAGEVVVTKVNEHLRERNFSAAMLLAYPVLPEPKQGDIGYHDDEFDQDGRMWFREHAAPGEPRGDAHDDVWNW